MFAFSLEYSVHLSLVACVVDSLLSLQTSGITQHSGVSISGSPLTSDLSGVNLKVSKRRKASQDREENHTWTSQYLIRVNNV